MPWPCFTDPSRFPGATLRTMALEIKSTGSVLHMEEQQNCECEQLLCKKSMVQYNNIMRWLGGTRKLMHIKSLGTAFQNFKMVCEAVWTHLLNLSIRFPPKQFDWVKTGRLGRQLHYRQPCLLPLQISLAQSKKAKLSTNLWWTIWTLLGPGAVCNKSVGSRMNICIISQHIGWIKKLPVMSV